MVKAVENVLPLGFLWGTRNPFLFCAHHHDAYPAGIDVCCPEVALRRRPLRFIFLIISVFLFINSSGQQKNYEIESILLDCLTKSYVEQQIDIRNELDKLENYLIECEFIQSSSGQSYFDFYTQIAQINEIPASLDYDRFENIYKLKPSRFYKMDCLEKLRSIESTIKATSKYIQVTIAIQQAAFDGMSPSIMAKAITTVLSPTDFDHPYYRTVALLTIAYTGISECGVVFPLEPIDTGDSDENEIMTISTTESNQAVLNGRKVSLEELKKNLTDYIQTNKSNHMIHCQADKRTSYGFYLKVLEQIHAVYDDLRSDLAVKQFSKSFNELTKSQQNEIMKIYPSRIREFVNDME